MPKFKTEGDAVAVNRDFILKKMPAANAAYVKIYLYILAKNGEVDYGEIAGAMALLESDVVNAVDYWVAQGVLAPCGESAPAAENSAPAPAPVAPSVSVAPTAPAAGDFISEKVRKSDYTSEQISDAFAASPALRDMIAMAEEILEKPLTPSEMDSLYWFYDGLGFSPEAVLMLLEYCVAKGKPRISYAEKVALSWCERGLVTPEDISRFMRDAERGMEAQKQIMEKMGIGGRPAAAGEEKYFAKWLGEYEQSPELVLLAHEYTLMQTGKLSFPYMDKILEKWHAGGISTTAAAMAEHDSYHGAAKKKAQAEDKAYDYGDLEQILRGK